MTLEARDEKERPPVLTLTQADARQPAALRDREQATDPIHLRVRGANRRAARLRTAGWHAETVGVSAAESRATRPESARLEMARRREDAGLQRPRGVIQRDTRDREAAAPSLGRALRA